MILEWEKSEKIGEVLLAEGVISVDDLQLALKKQKENGKRLGEILVSLGAVSAERLIYYIGEQLGISSIKLERYLISDQVLSLLGEGFIREKETIPLFVKDGVLHLAMVDPLETDVIEKVNSLTGLTPEVHICSRKAMSLCIAVNFAGSAELPAMDLESELIDAGRALRSLLFELQRVDCTELHLESRGEKVTLRLSGPRRPPAYNGSSLHVNRDLFGWIKSFLRLGSERGQVGAEDLCVLQLDEKEFSVRLSALETLQGESLGIKLVHRDVYMGGLHGTGMSGPGRKHCESLLSSRRGLVIVASLPGDGRTATMYALLKHLADRGRTVYLIEKAPLDVLDFTHQVVTSAVSGNDPASSLETVMKHSPDVVAVGECIDAGILRNILSGPAEAALVIAPMSVKDFSEVWIKMCSMTGDPESISDTLLGVISQTHFRSSCPECSGKPIRGAVKSCPDCGGTGLGPQVPLYQVVSVTPDLSGPLQSCYDITSVDNLLRENGIKTIDDIGKRKAGSQQLPDPSPKVLSSDDS
jgi:type IV pilus assembly protein PilB